MQVPTSLGIKGNLALKMTKMGLFYCICSKVGECPLDKTSFQNSDLKEAKLFLGTCTISLHVSEM